MKQLLFSLLLGLCVAALYQPAALACEGDCNPAKCRHHEAGMTGHSDHMASAAEGEETALDPVCGMVIGRSHAADRLDYQGKTYYFCSKDEKEVFLKDPEKYLQGE